MVIKFHQIKCQLDEENGTNSSEKQRRPIIVNLQRVNSEHSQVIYMLTGLVIILGISNIVTLIYFRSSPGNPTICFDWIFNRLSKSNHTNDTHSSVLHNIGSDYEPFVIQRDIETGFMKYIMAGDSTQKNAAVYISQLEKCYIALRSDLLFDTISEEGPTKQGSRDASNEFIDYHVNERCRDISVIPRQILPFCSTRNTFIIDKSDTISSASKDCACLSKTCMCIYDNKVLSEQLVTAN